jgi:SCP-2 sterol transfer family
VEFCHRSPCVFSNLIATTDAFPASGAFDAIHQALTASEAERKDAIKKGAGLYAFTLTNSEGKQASWHIDLKKEGKVGTGTGDKPDGEFTFYFSNQ